MQCTYSVHKVKVYKWLNITLYLYKSIKIKKKFNKSKSVSDATYHKTGHGKTWIMFVLIVFFKIGNTGQFQNDKTLWINLWITFSSGFWIKKTHRIDSHPLSQKQETGNVLLSADTLSYLFNINNFIQSAHCRVLLVAVLDTLL